METLRELLFKPGAKPSIFLNPSNPSENFPFTLAALFGFWLISWLLSELITRRTEWRMRWGLHPLGDIPCKPSKKHPLEYHARESLVVQAVMVALFGSFLYFYAWPWHTHHWPLWFGLDQVVSPKTLGVLADSLLITSILNIAPYVIAMVIGWIPRRRLSVSVRGQMIPLKTWLGIEAKLTFFPLVLWLFFVAFLEAINLGLHYAPEDIQKAVVESPINTTEWGAELLGLGLLALLGVIVMPVGVIYFWNCKPLPNTELKTRLEELVKRSGVKARALLSWGTQRAGFANACVLGPWSKLRYILISPGLMKTLSDDEIEAVVAHELGHAKYGHLRILLIFLLTLASLTNLMLHLTGIEDPLYQAGFYLLLLIIYFRGFFGIISRACEREADLASAELIGSPMPLISSLERIAVLSGNIRNVYSWHHDSIAKRVDNLRTYGFEPTAIQRVHRRLNKMRWGLTLLAILTIGANIGVTYLEENKSIAEKEPLIQANVD